MNTVTAAAMARLRVMMWTNAEAPHEGSSRVDGGVPRTARPAPGGRHGAGAARHGDGGLRSVSGAWPARGAGSSAEPAAVYRARRRDLRGAGRLPAAVLRIGGGVPDGHRWPSAAQLAGVYP